MGDRAPRNYPFNCWWVAATADEVTRKPLCRWLLEQRIVLYRTEEGAAVAREDARGGGVAVTRRKAAKVVKPPDTALSLLRELVEDEHAGEGSCMERGVTCSYCGMFDSIPDDYDIVKGGPVPWVVHHFDDCPVKRGRAFIKALEVQA